MIVCHVHFLSPLSYELIIWGKPANVNRIFLLYRDSCNSKFKSLIILIMGYK